MASCISPAETQTVGAADCLVDAAMVTLQELLNQAVAHHRAGQGAQAEALYRLALRTAPLTGDAARLLGLLLRRSAPDQAVALSRQALAIDPALLWVMTDLGLVLKEVGQTDEAMRAFGRALRLGSLTVDALIAVADIQQATGQTAAAAAVLRAVLNAQPDHERARLELGSLAQRQGDPDQAVAWLRSLLACAPALPEGLFNLALVQHLDGRLPEAERLYGRLLRLQPDHGRAEASAARLRLMSGDLDGAEAGLRRAGGLLPGDADTVRSLARCARYRAAADRAVLAPGERVDGLVVRGPFRDTSGYAHMVRRFVQGLTRHAFGVDLIDLNVDFVPMMEHAQRDPALERLDRPIRARSLLTFAIPSIVERVPNLRSVNFTMFEAHPAPPSWIHYAASGGRLIVPTDSSRQAWLDAGFPEERVGLCPLGVDPVDANIQPADCVDPQGRRLSDHPVRLLNVSDLIDRKNLGGLLRTWFRATGPEDGAALVLKLGKGQPDDHRRASVFIEQVARSVGKRVAEAGPLFLVQGVLSDAEMLRLFAACTHYCSLSHGEGWDLPMAQAGAMGLELIAPRHSAYVGYLNDEVAHLIPAHPVPALPPYQGLTWWKPDEDAAADLLAGAIARRIPTRSAREHLLSRFSWASATDRLVAVLRDMEAL